MMRTIKEQVRGIQTQDGAGVKLTRVLSRPQVKAFDPFLMLDAFDAKDSADYVKGFPWHPHRGIETITYLIDGLIEHQDSLGNKGLIGPGDCQWMTAGSGILHQETPLPSNHMFGIQLWLNLASRNKMTHPQYRDIQAKQVPVINHDNATIRIISGYFNQMAGAIQPDYVPLTFLDVAIKPASTIMIPTKKEDTVFAYIMTGKAVFEEKGLLLDPKQAVLFHEGEELMIKTNESDVRFFLFMAPKLSEPVAWGGPIVMNTEEELRLAFQELRNNTFIKTK
jgi:hypothetical protein